MPAVGRVKGVGVGDEVVEGGEEGGEAGYLGRSGVSGGGTVGDGGKGTWMRAESETGEGEERRWRGCLSVILLYGVGGRKCNAVSALIELVLWEERWQ